jgi:hypothetical protein
MTKFQMALMALQTVSAATKALADARQVYEVFKAEAARTQELTPEENAELDAKAAEIEASEAQKPSGR